MNHYTETELLTLARDILAKPGAMTPQDVRELDEIGKELDLRRK